VTTRLRARELAKSYVGTGGGRLAVLSGVSLDVAAGEFLAVAGPSGSGKSTLLNLLGLLEAPDAGEIWVGDVRASHLSRSAQAQVRGRPVAPDIAGTQQHVLERRDHYPPQLSGGEQQRVAYCRAVLNRPPVVLADEPTGSLDEANGRVILGELRALAQAAGAAIVMVTHRPEAVAEADRVLHLHAGRLADAPVVKQQSKA